MYFKQIDIAGFKSFADRLEIKFNSGITAIVGPNGCGKSNVADAIRWVLGEQSSKLLRGSSMQDVIFNGTEKRKSLSYAEVTLSFDNSDHFFNFNYDELAITRKLYRSGESEYLINRVPCRLKDIIDLLHDSGIGRDGYSIIGQGKVEEIISSKPENRRGIFEEAAGIAKFKSKKAEAERKLERVRDNLTRIKDITGEIERQLEPLKQQSEAAKKFFEIKSTLKDLEVNIYIYQYDNASASKQKIATKLAAITNELELRQADLEQTVEKYNKNMNDVNNIDKLMESLHQEVLELTVGIEKQAGEVKVIRERINLLSENNDKINIDIMNSKNNSIKLQTEKEVKSQALKQEKENLVKLNSEANSCTERYMTIIDELALSEDEAETSQKQMIDALDKLTDIKSKMSRLLAEKAASEENLKVIDQRIASIKSKVSSQEALQEDAKKAVEAARQQKQTYEKKCSDTELELSILNRKLKESEQEKNTNYSKIQVYENRRRLLIEMQSEFEGYAGSVKKLLKESEKNSAIKNKMAGVLASLIKVPQEFETAIEMALGNAVQNIVTFNESDAKELINYLKVNQFGRATFMPITTMRPRALSMEERRAINRKGCYGVADELISFDKNIAPVISNLLGATVVVEDLDVAIELAKNTRFSFKIVTLDGDIVNPQGSLTGGSKKSDIANLISREREIETLASEIEKMKASVTANGNEIEAVNQKITNLQNELTKSNKNKNEAEVWFAKESEKLDNIEFTVYSFKDEIEQSENSKKLAVGKITFIENEIASIEGLEDTESSNRKKANQTIESRQQLFGGLRKERDELVSKITEFKVNIANSESAIEGYESALERIDFELEDESNNLKDLERELLRNNGTIEGAQSLIAAQIETKATSESRDKLKEAQDKLANLDTSKAELQSSIKVLDENRGVLMGETARLTEKKHTEEMTLSKVDTDIEAMQERIYEEYQLTYETCQEFKRPDFDINKGVIEANRAKRDISKLGYINAKAIEDYEVLCERYGEYTAQIDDLEKSENDTTKIIKELATEMVTRFDTQFKKINDNFQKTFKELFGGGNARLELVNSDDLLEAGVEIVAEPPGKKLQSITLLSGGEKALTAIAILFAILKLRPMPFCLLDEIEAALDDANVERFAQYLRRFSSETQFIVITHRKPTMELADELYGVTMEEKGVSKIVSVKLSEAVKHVEVNNGTA